MALAAPDLVSPVRSDPLPKVAAPGARAAYKILGILGLLLFICIVTAVMSDRFLTPYNLQNLVRRTSLFGILGVGAAIVIITGGIDLSIGSVVALTGCLLPWLLARDWPVPAALLAVIGLSLFIGLCHGLLITRLRLQPFIVTLCGLLLYRGIARGLTADQTQGFGTKYEMLRALGGGELTLRLASHHLSIPNSTIALVVVAVVTGIFLNFTIWGRYLFALGRNEQAARYSGIRTGRMILLAYVACSLLAGLGGILFVLDINSAQPSDFGNFYELYAIAAAVLGGCSLRGGEGTVVGVVIGTAVMQVLQNSITLLGVPTQLEFAIIGAVILLGVIADELVKRVAASRRAAKAASGWESLATPFTAA